MSGPGTRSAFLAVAFVLLAVSTLGAHAEILRSDPPSGSVLANSPRQIQLWFSEQIEALPDGIVVHTAGGSRVSGGRATLAANDRSSLVAEIEPPSTGTYTVLWHAISADGHPISGSFTFSVGRADQSATAGAERDRGPSARWLQALGRWLHLLALVLVAGPLVMLFLLGREGHSVLVGRLWRLARIGALLGIPAAGVMLLAQTADTSGSLSGALHRETLGAMLHTRWGGLWAIRTCGILVLLPLAAWRARLPVLLSLAAVVLATALNGHSAATEPVVLSVAVDWLHLAATLAWVGGLLSLAVCVLPWTQPMDVVHRASLRRVVSRFSPLALVSVELLILTGLYHAWAHLPGPDTLLSTAYGQTLLVKLGLMAMAMAPAALNLLVVRPQVVAATQDDSLQTSSRRLRRSIAAEGVLAVSVLGAAALLTSLPATRDTGPERPVAPVVNDPPTVALVANAGIAHVKMTLTSGRIGSNRVHVSVAGPDGHALPATALRLKVEPPDDAGIAPWTVTPGKEPEGYAATLDLAPAGAWTVRVSGPGSVDVAFRFHIPLRNAGELLALADEAMNRLRSVVDDTTETASLASRRTRIELVAPDRRHSHSDVEEDVVIGSTRYTRHGATWHTEQTEPFRWPASALATSARDVVLLGSETLDGKECLVVQYVDSSSGAFHRVWLATPGWHVLQSTAVSPGRTVLTRYSGFDERHTISAPRTGSSP